jgi:iron complex transport system substrate-binding protein
VYALGLQERLAGDTSYCDTPPAAKMKPHVGAPLNPSLEAIVALRPDVVLASTSINRRETVDALARLGIAVYASNPHTVEGVLDSISRIAAAVGADAQGKELVGQLQAKLDELQKRLQDMPLVHVLFVVWEQPLITIGQNTFIADALRWAGAESIILSDQNWPQISFEEAVRLQPDYIVFTSNHTGTDPKQLVELRSRSDWSTLRAVELGQVLVLTDEIARPSAGLVDAIEQLARKLHPDAFSRQNGPNSLKESGGRQYAAVATTNEECAPCAR